MIINTAILKAWQANSYSPSIIQKLSNFEDSIGVEFKHIRLLARAFTDRSIGFNNLTLGSNQRLEFLGDTVLQLVSSEYLYRYFPEHHEGHLSVSLIRLSKVAEVLFCTHLSVYLSVQLCLQGSDHGTSLRFSRF